MNKALTVLAALWLLTYPCLASDGSDWFAVSGATFVEAVGTGTSFLLVVKRADGRFALMAEGEEVAAGMTIKKIGSEQVLVSRGPGEQTAAPILRQPVPADILIMAICRLYSQNLVIAGDVDKLVSFSDGLLNYKTALPGFVGALGMSYQADERAIVIRKDGNTRKLPAASPKKEAGYAGHHYRAPLPEILGALETQFQKTFKAKKEGLTATVNSADLTPEELTGYLAAAVDADIAAEAPKAVAAPAAPASAVASPAPASAVSEGSSVEAEFKDAVGVAKGGDYKKSAGMLLKMVRSHREVPGKVTNLLGKLLWSLGKRDMARKAWMITLKREPENDFARKALAKTAPRGT